jgi:hypothetical protein
MASINSQKVTFTDDIAGFRISKGQGAFFKRRAPSRPTAAMFWDISKGQSDPLGIVLDKTGLWRLFHE